MGNEIGSSTLRKKHQGRGTEPDDCYYFNSFELIADKDEIDLSVDPPPDLAFEVDITSPSLKKFPIYASIGVPELWRYDGEVFTFYRLVNDEYVEIDQSDLFPFLAPDVLSRFLWMGEEKGAVVMANEFSAWVKENRN